MEERQKDQQQEQKRRQEEESRRQLLVQILTSEARERSRVHLVKPEKAKVTEDYLISMAKTGRLRDRVSEDMLIQLLGQVTRQEQEQLTKIVVQRRGDEDALDLSEFGL